MEYSGVLSPRIMDLFCRQVGQGCIGHECESRKVFPYTRRYSLQSTDSLGELARGAGHRLRSNDVASEPVFTWAEAQLDIGRERTHSALLTVSTTLSVHEDLPRQVIKIFVHLRPDHGSRNGFAVQARRRFPLSSRTTSTVIGQA